VVFETPLEFEDLYRPFYCEATKRLTGSYYTNLAKCCDCKHFPCQRINKKTAKDLQQSDLMQVAGGKFKRRMKKMYLFLNQDGGIEQAYSGFDPANPDWDKLRDVKEVLCVNKVLVPQMKLVAKPKEAAEKPPEQAPAKAKSGGGKAKKKA